MFYRRLCTSGSITSSRHNSNCRREAEAAAKASGSESQRCTPSCTCCSSSTSSSTHRNMEAERRWFSEGGGSFEDCSPSRRAASCPPSFGRATEHSSSSIFCSTAAGASDLLCSSASRPSPMPSFPCAIARELSASCRGSARDGTMLCAYGAPSVSCTSCSACCTCRATSTGVFVCSALASSSWRTGIAYRHGDINLANGLRLPAPGVSGRQPKRRSWQEHGY
mmetsp:Transcript_38848/g.91424  ORF Transcript_38848/g.91424 Transcript_38848/m.91424 type:complete len:223 (+) Transcript_38848:1680-2348(+)